jgi:hypothetical protein
VHTLGFGLGRTGAGLARIGDVCGGVAEIQGLEPGSSPTSGTFSHVRGCRPLSVDGQISCYGPFGGFSLVNVCLAWCLAILGVASSMPLHSGVRPRPHDSSQI